MSIRQVMSSASDVEEHHLRCVEDCVESWFPPDGSGLNEHEFIDRLCGSYLNADGWDIEDMGNPAVRKIMRHARQTRSEMR